MTEKLPFNSAEVAERLLAWYGREGRDLPWRQTRDPYHIWLSEIMLQQTTVAAVIPYYEAFLERFPDVASLAAAPVEAVIEQWAGLGYYRRARYLHAAAQRVVDEHGGQFPADPATLQALPGIGHSTAGAILSIAFDIPAPILDGNVRRVLCRLFALQLPPRSAKAEKQLWAWAELLTPEARSHDYAQAIMDLGATVCLPKGPRCDVCPLESLCQGRRLGLETKLPLAITKKVVPTVRQVALAVRRGDLWLVRRRPLDGMLGGLWEFPVTERRDGEGEAVAAQRLAAGLGIGSELQGCGAVRHVYSHFRLELALYTGREELPRIAEGIERRALTLAELRDLPLHGAHKKLLALMPED